VSVFAAYSELGFKRLATCQRLPTFILKSRHIVRMETSDARDIGLYLVESQPCEVQHERVRANGTSIGREDDDGLRDRVDDAPQL